jgi:hypothetical protein
VVSEKRTELNENWEVEKNASTAYNFPTQSDFVNSMSPHPTHLALMKADNY